MSHIILGGLLQNIAGAPPVMLTRQALPALAVRDMAYAGACRVAGTVMVAGTPDSPVHRRVRLYDRRTALLVREAFSDSVTGAYAFQRIAAGRYFVVAHDHTDFFNAVIADDVTAEPMP